MTNAELNQKQIKISTVAAELSALIGELVGPAPSGQIANAAYAAQSHLQDGMNRVSNIFMFLAQKTDENVQAVVDKALQGGAGAPKLQVLEGGEPPAGG